MRVVDLFCGAGGFSEGFERAGLKIIRAYDIWEPAIITHNQNHGNGFNPAVKRDVYEISMLEDEEFEKAIPDSEVIIGSPPCVAFSNSNRSGKADKSDGIKLINAFLRIVARKLAKPNSILKYWVMENVENSQKYVRNSYSADDLEWPPLGDFLLDIKERETYNMRYFGVPTNRKRFICGDFPRLEKLNGDEDSMHLREVLTCLGAPNPEGYLLDYRNIIDPVYGFELENSSLTDHHYIKEIPEFEWKKAKRQKRDKGYMGRMSFPENLDKPSRTIMATLSGSSRESMIFELDKQNQRYRYPTIREAATLMSFPIDFRFYGDSDTVKYRMIGNAVTPKFSYEIAKCIREDFIKDLPIVIEDRFNQLKNFNDNDEPFTNLNGTIYPLKEEKEKRPNAKFNHHVPYLIIKAYRVGLNNKFENNLLSWEVKIHHSQGKYAKVFDNINVNLGFFEEIELNNMYKFIEEYILKIKSAINLQKNFCLPTLKRHNLVGPDELLVGIKEFLNEVPDGEVFVKEVGRCISRKIICAYYLLFQIIRGLN